MFLFDVKFVFKNKFSTLIAIVTGALEWLGWLHLDARGKWLTTAVWIQRSPGSKIHDISMFFVQNLSKSYQFRLLFQIFINKFVPNLFAQLLD